MLLLCFVCKLQRQYLKIGCESLYLIQKNNYCCLHSNFVSEGLSLVMAHVLVLDSLDDDIFVCGKCKSVYNSLELFLAHKKNTCILRKIESSCIQSISDVIVRNEISMPSETAYARQTTEENRDTTPRSENWMLENKCNICKKTFKTKKGYIGHVKTHNSKSYQCLVCGRSFSQNSHLQRHKLCHKVWPESLSETTPKCPKVEILSYSCPYCTMVFSTYAIFRSHLKNHQSFKKFKCIQGDCKNFYDTYEMLLHHVAGSHITQVYTCHVCNELFDSLQSIASHEISHNDITKEIKTKQFKCSLCDAVFTKADKLSLHMLTENHQKVCIHCNKTFASDKRLRLHLQTHRNLKPYECNICQKSFHMKKYLNAHMLKHGDKHHKCPECKHMFSRIDILNRHRRKHNANKCFQCPYKDKLGCTKEFTRSDKLKLHLKRHKNEKMHIEMEFNKNLSVKLEEKPIIMDGAIQ